MESQNHPTHIDVLVVGAGLSGIAAGHYLRERCPQRTFQIFEARERLGGTWDLFRYPGIRSDSDMYTLGYSFRPWEGEKAIADGPDILQYLKDTVQAEGLEDKIHYNRKIVASAWDSKERLWTVTVEDPRNGEQSKYTTSFLFMCSGYYDYEQGYTPNFPGREDYQGQFIHPQFWPEDLDYTGKDVVVIGSGATAITLLPNLAKHARKATMLQRSPTYVLSLPLKDKVAHSLKRYSPQLAHDLTRAKNIVGGLAVYQLSRKFPRTVKKLLMAETRRRAGNAVDVDTHFNPRYNPWEERLCVIPHGDLFKSIEAGKADVVTAHIERFTKDGILLKDGRFLPADIIISATGLNLSFLSGMGITIDGEGLQPENELAYKGLMLSNVPNMAHIFGYTNASWTLKAELACKYICRVLNHMDKKGYEVVCAVNEDPSVKRLPLVDFSSGYFLRALDKMPSQGDRAPWRVHQNYFKDMVELRFKPLRGSGLQFVKNA